ncbi:MAG: hypothetical protein Q8P13_02160 [bacterium]|nr:hypothetical protein [bacterium]
MLSTPHLLIGAALVKAIPNPAISLPAAFASHFVLDATPHWDGSPHPPFGKKFYFWVGLDYLFGLFLIWWFARSNPQLPLIMFGGFLGTAPDFMLASFRGFEFLPWNKWAWYKKLNNFHRGIQSNVPPASGFVTAAVAVGLAIFLLVKV